MPQLQVRPMHPDDVKAVAFMHGRLFPEDTITHLGPNVLQTYYRLFLQVRGCSGVVMHDGSTLVGFAVATHNSAMFRRQLYRHGAWAIIAGLSRAFTSRRLRRGLWGRLSHALPGLRPPSISRPADPTTFAGQRFSRLLVLAVEAPWRGSTAAARLVTALEDILREQGIGALFLTVAPNNARAIAFYRKTGWLQDICSDYTLIFRRSLATGHASACSASALRHAAAAPSATAKSLT